jgi:uncharacterized protein YdcH (DUF465 family)
VESLRGNYGAGDGFSTADGGRSWLRSVGTGDRHNTVKGGEMFESDEEIVQELLSSDEEFKRLYQKHQGLKDQVHQANEGSLPLDDVSLENLKKQKLLLKDRMAAIIANRRRSREAVGS